MTLIWNGKAVLAQVRRAAAEGTAETVDVAVVEGQANTPVATGAARDSVRRDNDGMSITWGYHVAYGIWIEIGARGKAGVHALRRAGDSAYAGLSGRIARRLR